MFATIWNSLVTYSQAAARWIGAQFVRASARPASGVRGGGTRTRGAGPSIFDEGGEAALRPAVSPDASAPSRRGGSAGDDGAQAPPAAAILPRIQKMRRAAVVDIFDQLSLDIVPGQIWRFIGDQGPIDVGITEFFTKVGVDAEKLRRRNVRERARANDVLELLVRIDGAFGRVGARARQAIEAAIFSGDYDRVRRSAEIVAIYEAILRLAERWEKDDLIRGFRQFLGQIQDEIDDPLSSTLEDAEQAQSVAEAMNDYMMSIALQLDRYAHLRATIFGPAAPNWRDWPEGADIAREMAVFEEVVTQLRTRDLAPDDVDAMIGELTAIIDKLEAVIASRTGTASAAGGGRSRTGGGSRAGGGGGAGTAPPLNDLEKALIFFGFKPTEAPAEKDIKKRYLDRIKIEHPDRGGSVETAKEVNYYYEVLKARFRKAA